MTTERNKDGIDLDIKDAIEGYERFRRDFERDKAFFKSLATKKQKPRLLWIGCSDSRVIPSQITSADPGELFEVRNIANCVPPSTSRENAVGAAVEYAILHLGVDDIVICGHTGCGGIQALSGGGSVDGHRHLTPWVELTRRAHQLIEAAQVPDEARHLETVRAHVLFQLDNLMSYGCVRDGVGSGKVGIHGWIYDMERGLIEAYDAETGDWRELGEEGET